MPLSRCETNTPQPVEAGRVQSQKEETSTCSGTNEPKTLPPRCHQRCKVSSLRVCSVPLRKSAATRGLLRGLSPASTDECLSFTPDKLASDRPFYCHMPGSLTV
ncbi:hypothetical protein CSUI_004719 [Cystoisospora suis]|uniref:Uncharacterized protein n=1 Tax=Cystoisospora suis TaxID=483139 RepID=A0A2C6KWA1_9APIC|nr:hypothetical protein CSUI_004719 [Cystoisospora suis]